MTLDTTLALLLAVVVAGYLLYALLHPEDL